MQNGDVKGLLAGAVLLAALPAGAVAQVRESPVEFDIPAQSVGPALKAFTEQANLQVVYMSTIADGRVAGGISGRYSPEDALTRLLGKTGLHYRFMDQSVVAISDREIGANRARASLRAPANPGAAVVAAVATAGDDHSQAPAQVAQTPAPLPSSVIEEITVTARRRPERLQDVPAAVTAITDAEMVRSGIEGLGDLFSRAPNLYVSRTGNSSNEEQLIIRGVGVRSPLEPSVAVFLDDVYVPFFYWRSDFVELQQVEVMRGPQGALFGRNTEAGAINLISKQPQLEFGGRARMDADSFGGVGASLYLTGALSDKVAVSLASSARAIDGYVVNINTGTDAMAGTSHGHRLSLHAVPSDNLTVDASVDYTVGGGAPDGAGTRVIGSTDPRNQPDEYETTREVNDYQELENFGASLRVQYDFAAFNLKSITAYRDGRTNLLENGPYRDEEQGDLRMPNRVAEFFGNDRSFPNPMGFGGYQTFTFTQNIVSQEFKATSTTDGPLKWVAGVYAFEEDNTLDRGFFPTFVEGPFAALDSPNNAAYALAELNRVGYAVFGQASWTFDSSLELAAGLRYQHERSDLVEMTTRANFGDGRFVRGWSNLAADYTTLFPGVPDKVASNRITPMGSIKYSFAPEATAYATISQGSKSGGFTRNPAIGAPLPGGISFSDEVATNYEIGIKTAFLGGRGRFNAAVFRVDVADMQVDAFVPDGAGSFVIKTGNAAAATTKGFEAELTVVPMAGLTLNAAVAYTDATFDHYVLNRGDNVAIDIAGERIESVPDWTVFASADYVAPLTGGTSLLLGAEFSSIGDQIYGNGTFLTPFTASPSQNWVNLRVGVERGSWTLMAFVNNVFDRYNVTLRRPTPTSPFLRPDIAPGFERPGAPRMYGVRVSTAF